MSKKSRQKRKKRKERRKKRFENALKFKSAKSFKAGSMSSRISNLGIKDKIDLVLSADMNDNLNQITSSSPSLNKEIKEFQKTQRSIIPHADCCLCERCKPYLDHFSTKKKKKKTRKKYITQYWTGSRWKNITDKPIKTNDPRLKLFVELRKGFDSSRNERNYLDNIQSSKTINEAFSDKKEIDDQKIKRICEELAKENPDLKTDFNCRVIEDLKSKDPQKKYDWKGAISTFFNCYS